MRPQLDRIETRLQTLIEGSLAALLPWGPSQRQFAHQIVEALQTQITLDHDGSLLAPGLFLLKVHPTRLAYWQSNPTGLKALAEALEAAGLESGVKFAEFPEIRVTPDPALSPNDIQIHAVRHTAPLSDTAAMEVDAEPRQESSSQLPRNAFLIVSAGHVFPLDQPVISIGRRNDNQLVLDDPRVSRTHAQLRVVNGEFVVFDLNSSGGTFLNGARVTTAVLRPGDVISLAGIPLIYGQETGPLGHDPLDETRSLPLDGSSPGEPPR